jgi:hypothetical protein
MLMASLRTKARESASADGFTESKGTSGEWESVDGNGLIESEGANGDNPRGILDSGASARELRGG